MKNRKPKGKCIFCLSENTSFSQEEHIIPESLGGDEVIPKGFVCDQCNNYFGKEVENNALTDSPLAFARAMMCIKSKKKRNTHYNGFRFNISGTEEGTPRVDFHPDKARAVMENKAGIFIVPMVSDSVVRLLLKMGLEFIAPMKELDVYSSVFDKARNAARCPRKGSTWKIAQTALPPERIWKTGKDEKGDYAKRLAYSYSLFRPQNQVLFYFQYWVYCHVVPLSEGDFEERIKEINEVDNSLPSFEISTVKLA